MLVYQRVVVEKPSKTADDFRDTPMTLEHGYGGQCFVVLTVFGLCTIRGWDVHVA